MVSTHQRFEAVTFDYGNLDEWKSYFEEMKEIAKSCKVIEVFWNELKRKCDGLTFKDLQEEFDYSTVLLGGVTPNGVYKERSLAKVYADLFGSKPENIHDLVEKLNRKIKEPMTKIVVDETEFICFVKSVSDKVMSILRQAESKGLIDSADVDVELDYYGVLSDYKKLIEIIENFVNNVAKILPNYNQKSLFVWTLDMLTYRYMTTAYPELRDDRVFKVVKNVLGLNVIFSPDVEDDTLKREYEVYSYHDGSIGKELVKLFKIIWKVFNGEYVSTLDLKIKESLDGKKIRKALLLIFPEMPSPKKEFLEMAESALRRIGWKLPEYIKFVDEIDLFSTMYGTLRGEIRDIRYEVKGILVNRYLKYRNLSTDIISYRYFDETKELNKSIFDFLSDLLPMLFLLHELKYKMIVKKNDNDKYYIKLEYKD